jgi:hypothetical protein
MLGRHRSGASAWIRVDVAFGGTRPSRKEIPEVGGTQSLEMSVAKPQLDGSWTNPNGLLHQGRRLGRRRTTLD